MSVFVKIDEFLDLPLAELAKAKLESEGIDCHLANKHHVGINWLYSQALGGVKLYVRKQDENIARTILDTDESQYISKMEDHFPELEEDDLCRKCGSQNIVYINRLRFFGLISLLTGLPLYIFGVRYKCKDCGHKMKPL
jgi:rubredoxin